MMNLFHIQYFVSRDHPAHVLCAFILKINTEIIHTVSNHLK